MKLISYSIDLLNPSLIQKKIQKFTDYAYSQSHQSHSILTKYFTRPMILYVKKNKGKNLVGVEIGSYACCNAKNILQNLCMKKLYIVDPYLEVDMVYSAPVFDEAKKRLKKWKNKVTFVKKFSQAAVVDIPNNLDFVYIDGNHLYKFVKNDINMYYPKIRKGGIIGGHNFESNFLGVMRAVMEFVEENNLTLYVLYNDWWIVK